jgi:hypothetical protein
LNLASPVTSGALNYQSLLFEWMTSAKSVKADSKGAQVGKKIVKLAIKTANFRIMTGQPKPLSHLVVSL